ncbi:hypothetical protein K466DRAFT_453390, partial [Polyporus arcularius HHB13444]
VLFIYETVIMFTREVACFWTARWTGATLLFFATKWLAMTSTSWHYLTWSCHLDQRFVYQFLRAPCNDFDMCSCSVFQIANEAVIILELVPAAIFSALRAFVLSRSKLLGLLVLGLSLAPAGVNL